MTTNVSVIHVSEKLGFKLRGYLYYSRILGRHAKIPGLPEGGHELFPFAAVASGAFIACRLRSRLKTHPIQPEAQNILCHPLEPNLPGAAPTPAGSGGDVVGEPGLTSIG